MRVQSAQGSPRRHEKLLPRRHSNYHKPCQPSRRTSLLVPFHLSKPWPLPLRPSEARLETTNKQQKGTIFPSMNNHKEQEEEKRKKMNFGL